MPEAAGSGAALRTRGLVIGHEKKQPLGEPWGAELRAGEMVCLLGRNGAGKSTLLRTLGGVLPALAGEVFLGGRPLPEHSRAELARRLAMVLPGRPLVELLPVRELVGLGRHPHTGWTGRLGPEDNQAVERALADTGLQALASRHLGTLSDGESQRAMVARALAQEPEILLLDEPTAHLDLPARVEILRLLRNLAGKPSKGENGRGILLSTHDLDLAVRLADRLWLLEGGRLHEGIPEDLILAGTLGRAFGLGEALGGDLFTVGLPGEAEPHRGRILLEGEEIGCLWTRRALVRSGFQVEKEGGSDDQRSAIGLVVEGPPYRWRVVGAPTDDPGLSSEDELSSLQDVLSRLRSLR